VNFVDLHKWVLALPEFSDDPTRGGEKVLEAIQAAWIDEAGLSLHFTQLGNTQEPAYNSRV